MMKQAGNLDCWQARQLMIKAMTEKPKIRFGTIHDLASIVDIYNQAIRSRIATGDLDEFKIEDRVVWFEKFDDENPIYIVEVNDNIAGYGTLSPYRPGRGAMKTIGEISFFLDENFQSKGIGSFLVGHMIRDSHRIGKKTLLAILLDINEKSIGLLKKFGFQQWGHFPDIIELENQKCSQLVYGLKISSMRY